LERASEWRWVNALAEKNKAASREVAFSFLFTFFKVGRYV
jgi:hypothetical protein